MAQLIAKRDEAKRLRLNAEAYLRQFAPGSEAYETAQRARDTAMKDETLANADLDRLTHGGRRA